MGEPILLNGSNGHPTVYLQQCEHGGWWVIRIKTDKPAIPIAFRNKLTALMAWDIARNSANMDMTQIAGFTMGAAQAINEGSPEETVDMIKEISEIRFDDECQH